jgi:hypothetical protein
MAVSSFSSGQLLANFGWQAVNQVLFPTVFIAAGFLVWLYLRERPKIA